MTLIFIAGGARSGTSRKGEEIAKSLDGSAKPIFISTEVGEGIVPMHPVSRQFRDLSGIMNQEFARASDKVYFMKFGIAQELK